MDIKDILPVPDMREAKRILCIQPHPDDMDISAGATLSMLSDLGVEIYYLTVTDDSAGFKDAGADDLVRRQDQRKEEQMAAGKIIGVKGYHWLNYTDAGNWSQFDARNQIIKHIRMLRPDFIFTVDPWLMYEAHMDHIKTGHAASEALLLYNFPFIVTEPDIDKNFEPYDIEGIAFSFTARPNVVIDVGKYRERKFTAIAEHKSQFTEESLGMLKMYDEMRCHNLAQGKGFEVGEGFKVLHAQYMLHCFPEAIDY
jgi:N,N'-diacetylchitobiose non-reducing end deacetylase